MKKLIRKNGGRRKCLANFDFSKELKEIEVSDLKCPVCGEVMEDRFWEDRFVCQLCKEVLSYDLYTIYCHDLGIAPDDLDGEVILGRLTSYISGG